MTNPQEPSANERWLDQFLGDPIGEPNRADVLEALRGHVLGDIVIEEENPDGTTAMHVQGALVEASRDPDTWETAELFSVADDLAANAWHNSGPQWEEIAGAPGHENLRKCLDAAKQPPKFTFGVPETGITEYPGTEAGKSGYRFAGEDGTSLAVVLWHGVLHVTETGDVAPGLGGFTVELEEPDGE